MSKFISSRLVFALVVVCCSLFENGSSGKLPNDAKRCDRKSPDFGKCLIDACLDLLPRTTKALPEAGLPSLEPLKLPVLNIGAGTGPVAVEQKFKDVEIYGLSQIKKIRTVMFDFDKKVLLLEGTIDELKLVANYELDGKVLILPIKGEGPCSVILEKVDIHMVMPYEEVQKKGNTHFKFSDSAKLELNPKNVIFQFDNLFNGDKALGDNMNRVLNENSKEVFADIKRGYEEAFAVIVKGLTNNVFSRIPVKDIFIN